MEIKEIGKQTPALVINEEGKIIIMENNKHSKFFSKIISDKLKINVEEDNLAILLNIIVKQLNYISYMGCTSGDREYNGGTFHIKNIESLTDQQLTSLIDLFSHLSLYYEVNIIKISTSGDDQFISIGELFEESIKRQNIK